MPPDNASTSPWEGWWEQDWHGRQPMENLRLKFEAGRIEGSGYDIVGPFGMTGVIGEGGVVVIRKQYLGRYSVEYRGVYDGEGVLSGEWFLPGLTGPWLLRLRRDAAWVQEIRDIGPSEG